MPIIGVDELKSFLGATSAKWSDEIIGLALDTSERIISSVTNCSFESGVYSEWLFLSERSEIFTKALPLASIIECRIGRETAIELSERSSLSASPYIVRTLPEQLKIDIYSSNKQLYSIDFEDDTQIAELPEIIEVGCDIVNAKLVSVSDSVKYGMAKSIFPLINYFVGGVSGIYAPSEGIDAMILGINSIRLPKRLSGWLYVCYSAGFSQLPSDLKFVILKFARDLLDTTDVSALVENERAGDISVIFDSMGRTLIEDYIPLLTNYMRVAL